MDRLLFSLAFATAGAIIFATVPSEGTYQRSWNGTRYQPSRWNQTSYGNYSVYPFNRSSGYYPVHRYPRAAPFWGNSSQNGSHNFVWGTKSIYDRLLYYTRVKKSSSFLRKVTVDMDFPAKHQRPNGTIYYIEVLDEKPIGEGGYATILRGGIGYKNVTIHFKSQRNKGIDFRVTIYGR